MGTDRIRLGCRRAGPMGQLTAKSPIRQAHAAGRATIAAIYRTESRPILAAGGAGMVMFQQPNATARQPSGNVVMPQLALVCPSHRIAEATVNPSVHDIRNALTTLGL